MFALETWRYRSSWVDPGHGHGPPATPRLLKVIGSRDAMSWSGENARRIEGCEETDIERGVVCDEISCATKDDMFCPGGN